MKHLQSKWDGQFMQQEHLQKESKWQWYRWSQKMRNIGRSSVADQNQVTENPTTCTLLVQPLATFILQSLPSAVPKLAMGAAMFVLAMLSVCQNRMWGNNLSWYHMTRTSSGEECFTRSHLFFALAAIDSYYLYQYFYKGWYRLTLIPGIGACPFLDLWYDDGLNPAANTAALWDNKRHTSQRYSSHDLDQTPQLFAYK